jgi:hypothetical protein
MRFLNIVSKFISFSIFTYFNNSLLEIFPFESIKNIAFLFLECVLLMFFLSFDDTKEKKYNEVCLQNINFYNQMLKLQQTITELHKEKKEVNIQIREKFQKSLLEYQLQLQKCIFPFCLNDIKTNNLCKDHLKYKTEECVICFEKFDENYYPLKCGHWIHNKCLELTGNNKCSLCKKENIYFL